MIYAITFGCVKGHEKSFKLYVYKSMVTGALKFNTFLHQLIKGKNLEKSAAFNSKQKHDMLSQKSIIGNLLPQ